MPELDLPGLGEVTVATVLLLVLAAFAAGWVDAVVGGGGLIQLPALLLVPGISPVEALATNKLASLSGTAVSTTTFLRKIKPDRSVTLPAAVFAFAGAVLGAWVATSLPEDVFTPIILIALIGVAVYTLFKPSVGQEAILRYSPDSKRLHAIGWIVGLVIGFYDGMLGPGTGSFLVIAFVGLLGYSFLQGSITAKIINLATNVGALVFFIPNGSVIWLLGILMAMANALGGFLGAKTALSKGSGFIRIVFLIVVGALIIKLGWDVAAPYFS